VPDEADRTLLVHGAAYALLAYSVIVLVDQIVRSVVRYRGDRRLLSAPVGLVLAAATVAGLADAMGVLDEDQSPAVGVALLAVVGWCVGAISGVRPTERSIGRSTLGLATAVMVGVPSSWLVVGRADLAWSARVALAFAIPILAVLISGFDALDRSRRCAALLIAVTCAGVYVTVPDTEQALVLLGAATPCVVLTWPLRTGRVGRAGAFALVGVVTWVATEGGSGRPSSIVGAMACTGLLAVEPLARRVGRREAEASALPALLAIPAHVVLVGIGSRVVGMASTVAQAILIAVAVTLAASVALDRRSRWRGRQADRRHPPLAKDRRTRAS
jgi:hypothetical protein